MTEAADQKPTAQTSPVQEVLALTLGIVQTQALRLAAEFGIPDLLKDGPQSVAELARETKSDPVALGRVMAVLAHVGLVAQTSPDVYECTPTGTLLRSDTPNSVRHYAMLMGLDCFSRPWARLDHSVTTGTSAFAETMGTGVYDYFRDHPPSGAVMHQAMGQLSKQEGAAIRDAYDVSNYRHIVDLGGSRGDLLAILLANAPQSRGTLFDRSEVIAEAGPVLESAGVSDRVERIGGDFTKEVPPHGDLYLLKRILMDRTDDEARLLFRRIHAAMAPGGRIVVADPHTDSAYGKYLDLLMLVVFGGGRLRTVAELATLFRESGFEITRTIDTDSAIRLVEATASSRP
jgi:predicted O-methyltransferase YrrM